MYEIVRDPRVIGMFGKLFLQDRGGPGVRRVGLVGLRLRARNIKRAEYLCFIIVRVAGRQRFVSARAGFLAGALGAVGPVLVVSANSFDVSVLALPGGYLARGLDHRLCPFSVLWKRTDSAKRIQHQE